MANLYNPHLRTKNTSAKIMGDVCIALLPATIGAIHFFGLRALLLIIVSVLSCVISEALWQLCHKQEITIMDLSAVVTGILIAFNVSSTTPVWVVVLAGVFSIIVVKQFFGGLGSNVVNPALMGRLFIMLVYPAKMMSYVKPGQIDEVSSATILSALKHGGEIEYSIFDTFVGKVPGALGETSALLLLIGFAYLIIKKEVNWKAPVGFFAAIAVISAVAGVNPLYQLFSGGVVLGGCFMLTDYNFTGKFGKLFYGVAAGIIVAAIRIWGTFPEGVCYAILMVNCMSALMERVYTKHVYGVE